MTPRPPTRPDARRPPWIGAAANRGGRLSAATARVAALRNTFRTRLVGEDRAAASFLDAASAATRATVASRFSPNTPRARLRRGGEICKDRCVETRRTVVSGSRCSTRSAPSDSNFFHRPRGEIHPSEHRTKTGVRTRRDDTRSGGGAGWWAVFTRSRARRRSTTRADGFFNRQPPPPYTPGSRYRAGPSLPAGSRAAC